MADIYEYVDYRRFLKDVYQEHKKANQGFSYSVLSARAGFKNKGFLHNVMSGGKNLSRASSLRLAEALGLSATQAQYFENLVCMTQAVTARERRTYFDRLQAIHTTRKGAQGVRATRADQFEYYGKWYHAVVRSLLGMHDFRGDWARLAASVHPRIRPKQAREAVALLVRLGMVRKAPGGSYVLTDASIEAGPEIVSLGLGAFQLAVNDLARHAIADLRRDQRHVSGVTLGISRTTYESACAEIDALRAKLSALAEADEGADNVYQLAVNLFPVSDVNGLLSGRNSRRGGRAAGRLAKKEKPQ